MLHINMDKESVAELINKRVSKCHRTKYLDISYSGKVVQRVCWVRKWKDCECIW